MSNVFIHPPLLYSLSSQISRGIWRVIIFALAHWIAEVIAIVLSTHSLSVSIWPLFYARLHIVTGTFCAPTNFATIEPWTSLLCMEPQKFSLWFEQLAVSPSSFCAWWLLLLQFSNSKQELCCWTKDHRPSITCMGLSKLFIWPL